jgi:hypothetical protein
MEKVKTFITYMMVSFFSTLTPIKHISLTLVGLIVADFLFGIYRANKQGEKITSRKMSKSIAKILFYNIVILLLYYTNIYIFETGLPLEKLGAGLICLVELRSIDESWQLIFGYSLWDKISSSIERRANTSKNPRT